MTDNVIITLNSNWKDSKTNIQFHASENGKEVEYKGKRSKEGVILVGYSSFKHCVPWEKINEKHLNPNAKKES